MFVFLPVAGKNDGSHHFLNWWQQYATGILRFDYSNPSHKQKEDPIRVDGVFFMAEQEGFELQRFHVFLCFCISFLPF